MMTEKQYEILATLREHAPEDIQVSPVNNLMPSPNQFSFNIKDGGTSRTIVINKDTWDNLDRGVDFAGKIIDILKGLSNS